MLTNSTGLGTDAYFGPTMDCTAGQRVVRLWTYPSQTELSHISSRIKKTERIGIFLANKNYQIECEREVLEYWPNDLDEGWELRCEFRVDEAKEFFDEIYRSGAAGLKYGPHTNLNINMRGVSAVKEFENYCSTSMAKAR